MLDAGSRMTAVGKQRRVMGEGFKRRGRAQRRHQATPRSLPHPDDSCHFKTTELASICR